MKADMSLKLLSEVRDLQIVDSEGLNCGICDDIEFEGKVGERLIVRGLLVGPGTYRNRLPKWISCVITSVAGQSVVHVPWSAIEKISGRIYLCEPATSLRLRTTEISSQRPRIKASDSR